MGSVTEKVSSVGSAGGALSDKLGTGSVATCGGCIFTLAVAWARALGIPTVRDASCSVCVCSILGKRDYDKTVKVALSTYMLLSSYMSLYLLSLS